MNPPRLLPSYGNRALYKHALDFAARLLRHSYPLSWLSLFDRYTIQLSLAESGSDLSCLSLLLSCETMDQAAGEGTKRAKGRMSTQIRWGCYPETRFASLVLRLGRRPIYCSTSCCCIRPSIAYACDTHHGSSAPPRPLLCERSLLQRADGSAKWAQEGSAVLAAVHGPVAAGPRKENPERAMVEVIFKPRTGLPSSKEHELEEVLRQTVEGVLLATLHPRTLVTVVVQVLQADGSLLACAVNAACAALVDAGVPLASLFGEPAVG